MLTGNLVRVRFRRERICPCYIDPDDALWLEVAQRLIEVFRAARGSTRGELEEELHELFGDDPSQVVHQGLAKLLEDRCEMEVVSGHPPEDIRAAVFGAAARTRQAIGASAPSVEALAPFDREAVIAEAAAELKLTPDEVEQGLFADLRSEQRLMDFKDINPERLLHRYNLALAQAVVLRSIALHVTIRSEPPQRYRQLLRRVKFHRLVCEMEQLAPQVHRLHLDGPLSLFSATQKYGLQLALFLPAVLLCRDYEVRAEVRWSRQRKPCTFLLAPSDHIQSHYADTGTYVPAELGMFAELFRKRITDWELHEETEVIPLGGGFWVPDFRLVHRASGLTVLLEVLGFWRKSSAEQHLARLKQHIREPFLLAVSDQLHIDEGNLDGMPAEIHRFRNMPLPDEIARLANGLLPASSSSRLPSGERDRGASA